MRGHRYIAITTTLALTSCSYSYDLQAIVDHGRLAFVVDPKSRKDATCIRSIHVSAEGAARAKPADGDDRALVENGVFWWKDVSSDTCRNDFPVLYGQPLQGKPFLPPGVEAKPLRIGATYEVETTGSGSGYGSGRFRIRRDHTVENIPVHDNTAKMTEPANDS